MRVMRIICTVVGCALITVSYAGCAPTVYERAVAVCNGVNVRENTNALRDNHVLAPGAHVRCGR